MSISTCITRVRLHKITRDVDTRNIHIEMRWRRPVLISALERTHDRRANIRLDDCRMACDTPLSGAVRRIEIWLRRRGMGVCLRADGLDRRMKGYRGRCDGVARRVVVCLTRRESNRDRYGYTHPSPTVDLHTGKGCQIPERFSSPPPNGELVLASTFTVGSTRTGPSSLGYLTRKCEDERNNHLR